MNVVLEFIDPAQACASLGDAYRVEARIVLWEAANVLKVPTGALFRDHGRWAVFLTSGGRARLTPVELGRSHSAGSRGHFRRLRARRRRRPSRRPGPRWRSYRSRLDH